MTSPRHPALVDTLVSRGYELHYSNDAMFRHTVTLLDRWLTELDDALDREDIPYESRGAIIRRLLDQTLPEVRPEIERERLAAKLIVAVPPVPVLDVHAADPIAEGARYTAAVEQWAKAREAAPHD